MLKHMLSGPAKSCRPKQNGNLRPVADLKVRNTPGAQSSSRKGDSWRTHGRVNFRLKTYWRMGTKPPLLLEPLRRTDTACTPWPAMCGNGQPIGIRITAQFQSHAVEALIQKAATARIAMTRNSLQSEFRERF